MIADEMRAEFEASVDATDELAKQLYGVVGQGDGDGWSLYHFDIHDSAAPTMAILAQGASESHLVEAIARNWRIVDEATGGTYVRPPLTYACEDFNAALSEDLNASIAAGEFRPGRAALDTHIVVDGQPYQFGDISKEMFLKVVERYEHAKQAHIRRAHQIDYVMSRVRGNEGKEA
jgi:hypothetical protein